MSNVSGDGGIVLVPIIEEQAAGVKDANLIDLAAAHLTCLDPIASDEDVLVAVEALVGAVEREEQFAGQIDSAILTAQERGLIKDQELLQRLVAIGLSTYVAHNRSASFALLLAIATGDDPTAAKIARATMTLGPEGGTDEDRIAWRMASGLATEGKSAVEIDEIIVEFMK